MAENQKEKYLEEIEDQIRTIGVLTSCGDAPGMNAAIRAVVRTALSRGLKVRGIRRGFHGLLKEEIIDLSAAMCLRRSSAEVRSFRQRVVNLCVRKKDSRKRLQSVKNTVSTDL